MAHRQTFVVVLDDRDALFNAVLMPLHGHRTVRTWFDMDFAFYFEGSAIVSEDRALVHLHYVRMSDGIIVRAWRRQFASVSDMIEVARSATDAFWPLCTHESVGFG